MVNCFFENENIVVRGDTGSTWLTKAQQIKLYGFLRHVHGVSCVPKCPHCEKEKNVKCPECLNGVGDIAHENIGKPIVCRNCNYEFEIYYF